MKYSLAVLTLTAVFLFSLQIMPVYATNPVLVTSRPVDSRHSIMNEDEGVTEISSLFSAWSYCGDLVVDDSIAYVATGVTGVEIIDLHDPLHPTILGTCRLDGNPARLVKQDTLLLVHEYGRMLWVVNVADPSNPYEIGHFDGSSYYDLGRVSVEGDLAAVAGNRYGVRILDISDPAHPDQIGFHLVSIGAIRDVDLQDSLLVVAADDEGVWTMDVSDPTDPEVIGTWELTGTYYDYFKAVVRFGDIVYAGNESTGLYLLDISDPANIVEIDHLFDELPISHLRLFGDRLLVETSAYQQDDGLLWFDVSNPLAPVQLGVLLDPQVYRRYGKGVLMGDYVVTAGAPDNLEIYDITDPANPLLTSRLIRSERFNHIALAGDLAVVGNRIVDVSVPSDPVALIPPAEGYEFKERAIQDNYLYFVNEDDGIHCFDISNPTSPIFTSQSLPGTDLRQIILSGNQAFAASYAQGLFKLDASDPAVLVPQDTLNDVYVYSMCWRDGLLYVASSRRIRIIQASEGQPLSLLNTVDIEAYDTYGMAVEDTLLCLTYAHGMMSFSIADPVSPRYLGEYVEENVSPADLKMENGHAYLSSLSGGIRVLDLTDPAQPVLAGSYESEWETYGIEVRDGLLYVANKYSFRILDANPALWTPETGRTHEQPTALSISQVYPNPFNPTTTMTVRVPEIQTVRLSVYNLLGQEVAQLHRGVLRVGDHRFTLQAESLASGVYIAVLSSQGEWMAARRLVLMK
ncbi:T9SS type A sorting domain-containing protein [bacterium]|nr:T9SS type A sorting domain-containing protein [bacterium]